jgi:hypothetical protein
MSFIVKIRRHEHIFMGFSMRPLRIIHTPADYVRNDLVVAGIPNADLMFEFTLYVSPFGTDLY